MLGSCERMATRVRGPRSRSFAIGVPVARLEVAQHELVDQRRLARPAGTGDADDARLHTWHGRLAHAFAAIAACAWPGRPSHVIAVAVQEARDGTVDVLARALARLRRLPVILLHVLSDRIERRPRRENHIDAILAHDLRVVVGDRAPAAAEEGDVVAALGAEQLDDLAEELDMPAVVAADADRAHVFLDGGADDVARAAVEAEVNHLDAVSDELEVDRGDRAVVPVADRHGGEEADGLRWLHRFALRLRRGGRLHGRRHATFPLWHGRLAHAPGGWPPLCMGGTPMPREDHFSFDQIIVQFVVMLPPMLNVR